jgi:hypothetical protein
MYYKDIFSSIKEKELKDINIEDINDWNTKIKEDSQLISLALGTPEDVDTMVGNIIRLIKIRCRVIYLLLTNQA